MLTTRQLLDARPGVYTLAGWAMPLTTIIMVARRGGMHAKARQRARFERMVSDGLLERVRMRDEVRHTYFITAKAARLIRELEVRALLAAG